MQSQGETLSLVAPKTIVLEAGTVEDPGTVTCEGDCFSDIYDSLSAVGEAVQVRVVPRPPVSTAGLTHFVVGLWPISVGNGDNEASGPQ